MISSLYGSHTNDRVGISGIQILANGHFVIKSLHWDAGRGAATWCSASAGCSGIVSAANSVVGSTPGDGIGNSVTVLAGGAFVVYSRLWDYPALAVDAGAARWCPGTGPCIGPLSEANSLVGDQAGDYVGEVVLSLSNGHYVVQSDNWHGNRGAVTWCSGLTGRTGKVATSNSLYGSTAGDRVGTSVQEVSNGGYLVISPYWDNGLIADVGAVSRCTGTSTCSGAVNEVTSLVGSHAEDKVGFSGVTVLPSGNYVIQSINWNGRLGAATWCSGTGHCSGPVTASNSLVGSTAFDYVGERRPGPGKWKLCGQTVLHGMCCRGAVTWCDGASGCSGTIDITNSLVGKEAGDQVGENGVALAKGNYVVTSPSWNAEKGAATWCDGEVGCTGSVSAVNSLVGGTAGDRVGSQIAMPLTNGNYVVRSNHWSGGSWSKYLVCRFIRLCRNCVTS